MSDFLTLYGDLLDQELASDRTHDQLFTTARRQAAINRAQIEFADLTDVCQRTSTLTITGGTAEYNLASTTLLTDFVRLGTDPVEFHYTDSALSVTMLSGDDLPLRDLSWLQRYEPSWKLSTVAATEMQLPSLHYLRTDGGAQYLGFWPTPSTGSSASAKVIVPYVFKPTDMSADADEPFTVSSVVRTDLRPYHQALVHHAAYQLEKLRRDDQASASQLQQFMGYVSRWIAAHRHPGGRLISYARNPWVMNRTTARQQDPRR